MERKPLYLLQLLGFVFLFSACQENGSGPVEYDTKRLAQDRVYKDLNPVQTDSIELIQNTFILEEHRGKLYINEWNAQRIQELDKDLNLVSTYANKGSGPNEFLSLIKIAFEGNSIYGIDSELKVIKEFEVGGTESKRLLRFEDIIIDKAVPLGDDLFLACGQSHTQAFGFFVVSAKTGKIVKEVDQDLNKVINKTEHPSLAYDGNFVVNKATNQIIYYCYMYNQIYVFDQEGELVREIKTIDNTPLPAFVENRNITAYRNGIRSSMASLTVEDNQLFVLSRAPDSNSKDTRPIDVYDLATGDYSYSFLLPATHGRPTHILKDNQFVFVLYKDFGILKYSLDEVSI